MPGTFWKDKQLDLKVAGRGGVGRGTNMSQVEVEWSQQDVTWQELYVAW